MFCRWVVRYLLPTDAAKRPRTGLESPVLTRARANAVCEDHAPVLRRANALGEEGFRDVWTSPNISPRAPPSANPVTNKVASKKRKPEEEKTITPKPQRVTIAFPPMTAPFGGPQKYDDLTNTATLTLSLRNEHKIEAFQTLRQVLTDAENTIGKLIQVLDPLFKGRTPISAAYKNTLIRPGKATSEGASETWPDTIPLKMYPDDVFFKDPNGHVLIPEEHSFFDFDVQPTVELRDVWKVNGVYYPRLVITDCVLRARAMPAPIVLPLPAKPAKKSDLDYDENEYSQMPTPEYSPTQHTP